MAQYKPYLYVKQEEDGLTLYHNKEGRYAFYFSDKITDREAHLIEMAIEEGKRRKAIEIRDALF